jgi:hypothetical protein
MKNKIMKTLIVFLLITIGANFKSNAQIHLCEDPCPPGNKLWKTITLCSVAGYITYDGNGNQVGPLVVPTVFVEIAYRIRTCNGVTTIIIEDYVFVDNRDYLITVDPFFGPAIASTPCGYPNPPTTNSIDLAIANAISLLLNDYGNPAQGSIDVIFKGSCNSSVSLNFPDSSFFTSAPDDAGKIDTFFVGSGSHVSMVIPCDDVCCKVSYNWQMVTLINGETLSKWVPISSEGDIEGCESASLPDYYTSSQQLKFKKYDPTTGLYTTVSGSVVGQESCKLICPRILSPPPLEITSSLKSDLSISNRSIELTASPVPFNNFIKIDSNREILKIAFYDLHGKLVLKERKLDEGQINTSNLDNGIYFLQVYFTDNIVKTIKIVKQ